MLRDGIAPTLARGLLLLLMALYAQPATGQLGPMHVPPIKQRPFSVHAELIDRSARASGEAAEVSAEALDDFNAPAPPFSLVSEISSHVVFLQPLRLERPDRVDLLLTFVGRDRRRVRARLEEEGAPAGSGRTLIVSLDRVYGMARGRLVTALGPTGPWLRIDLKRP